MRELRGSFESRTSALTGTAAARRAIPERNSKLVFYIPLLIAAVTLLLLALALASGWLGRGMHVGSRFGEAPRAGWIKEPSNTYSSLGFVFAGLWISWRLGRGAHRHNPNLFTRQPFFAALFASCVVCLGPGSIAMHATESRLGGRLDLLSMYFIAAYLTAYAVGRFFKLRSLWFVGLFAAVSTLCFEVQDQHYSWPLMHNFGDFIFGFFIAVGALFEALNLFVRRVDQELKWGALSLGMLLVAFLIWNLSLGHRPSRSLLQGHALWHLLCAVAAYCLFRYYVSERQVQPDPVPLWDTDRSMNRGIEPTFTTSFPREAVASRQLMSGAAEPIRTR